MDDLLAEFVAEAREMLAAVESELVAWEADPGDRTRLDAIFRFVHTIKGNCGFFDFPRLEALSHAAESALAAVRAGTREADKPLVDTVLAVIDRIADLIETVAAGEPLPQEDDRPLIAALAAEGDGPAGGFAPESASALQRRAAPMAAAPRSIRLPVDLLDRLMSGVSDMVLARNDLARRLRDAGNQPAVDGAFARLSAILDDVREGVSRMRMQRIENLYHALPRVVRDLAGELGKQVVLDLQDGDVELDREMIEVLRDPLTHLIRNAVDHGIEPPDERARRGKPEAGLLSLSARQAGNRILLVVRDDGRGLDVERIAAKAVAGGLVTPEGLAAMAPAEQLGLIFEPGLSTAERISEVSGRGVGMDVVRANLEKVGGTIRVESEAGEGTVFVLELPLTLSMVAALTVTCGEDRYAIPRSYIEEIARGSSAAIALEELGQARFVRFRDRRIPAIGLDEVLAGKSTREAGTRVFVIVRLAKGDRFALIVDSVLDSEDLVVKPLAPAIMNTGIYAGSTLLDDGLPLLILDIPRIAARHGLIGSLTTVRQQAQEPAPRHARGDDRAILFTDAAGRRRAIRMAAVARIETLERGALQREGGHWHAALDGAILPLAGLGADGAEDAAEDGALTVLRLRDGTAELLLAARAVEDSATIEGPVAPLPGEDLLEGTAMVGGELTALVDCHALFARHAAGAPGLAGAGLRTCRLADDDEWAATFLRPLLESAGYAVVGPEWTGPVDLAVVSEGADRAGRAAARVLHVRAAPLAAHPGDGSIYRYDRTALLAALRAGQGGAA